MNTKETMLVEAICNGTVLDHIPSEKLFKIVNLLGLDSINTPITIGNNLESKRCRSKGVIKITDRFFSEQEINRIAILAPDIRLNIIRNYEVVEKKSLSVPPEVVALVRCSNPKCITNSEPMPTRFAVEQLPEDVRLECHYCGRRELSANLTLL